MAEIQKSDVSPVGSRGADDHNSSGTSKVGSRNGSEHNSPGMTPTRATDADRDDPIGG